MEESTFDALCKAGIIMFSAAISNDSEASFFIEESLQNKAILQRLGFHRDETSWIKGDSKIAIIKGPAEIPQELKIVQQLTGRLDTN